MTRATIIVIALEMCFTKLYIVTMATFSLAVFIDKESSFSTNEEISRNGFGHHQQDNGERSRSPAKLPPTDTINVIIII